MSTLKVKREFIQGKLRTNREWALRALQVVYSHQTTQEKAVENTIENNRVGFSGVDAELLSSFAKQYETRRFLTSKQMVYLHRKIVKYWRQILEHCDPARLTNLIEQEVVHV
jgi:hypothetical protein